MATRKRRTASPSPSPSPPRKQQHSQHSPLNSTPTTTTTTALSPTQPIPPPLTSSIAQAADPSLPPTPLPADIDMNRCPFTLTSPHHNLLLTLLTQSNNTPHPWIKCHKCGKWRKLPPTLSALSPLLPSLPLTLQSLSSLSAPFLPFPFTCSAVHWDLDRRICSAIQDYQDIVHEWHQVPLKLVRANPRFDFYVALAHFLRVKGVTIREYPCIYGKSVDLFALYNLVHWAGGDAEVTRRGWWGGVYERLRLGGKVGQAADVDYLVEIYRSYFFEWQESKPAVFDDGEGGAEEAKEGKENVRAGGSEADGQSAAGAGVGAKAEEKQSGQSLDEVKEAESESKEQAGGDTEMRASDSKEQQESVSAGVREEKQHEAEVTGSSSSTSQPHMGVNGGDGDKAGQPSERTQSNGVSKPADDTASI